jgi:hypothetical protein
MDKVKEREGGDSKIEIEAEKGEMIKTLRDRDIVRGKLKMRML